MDPTAHSNRIACWLILVALAAACTGPRHKEAARASELVVLSDGLILRGPVLSNPDEPESEAALHRYLDRVAQGDGRLRIRADQSTPFHWIQALLKACEERGIDIELTLDRIEPKPVKRPRSAESSYGC